MYQYQIKSVSTPNKKYEKILSKNFMMLKLNEFRTSIIEYKSEIKCENLIKKNEYKNMKITSVFALEKLKIINEKKYKEEIKEKRIHKILTCKTSENQMKYINRDINATKNMIKIMKSYIKSGIKPKIFVFGTKICNNVQHII